MKSISFAGLFVSTLVVSASAFPHFNSIFGRGGGDDCYTAYGQGTCGSPKDCKGITVGKKYCGGSGDYQSQCCVELVCNVPAGKGWCRDVKDGDYPGGSFQYSEYGNSEWPCIGGDIQCWVPGSNNSTSTSNPTSTSTSTKTPTKLPTKTPTKTPTSTSTSIPISIPTSTPISAPAPISASTSTSDSTGGNAVINAAGVAMLKELEGFRGDIYKDQVGVDTIGYGHNCAAAPGSCEAMKQPISPSDAENLLMKDLEQFEKCVCSLPNSEGLNSNQFSALVSFAFNTGCFGTSDYFKDLMNKKDYSGICSALPNTNTANGAPTSRREAEAKLCSTPMKQTCGCKGSN